MTTLAIGREKRGSGPAIPVFPTAIEIGVGKAISTGFQTSLKWISLTFPVSGLVPMSGLGNQHRISVAEEPVFLFDRCLVGTRHQFVAAESPYHHQQRAARKMEIGDQPID